MIPNTAVRRAPVLKEKREGFKLTKAFAGAMIFAAMFVVSVANVRPMKDVRIGMTPPICPSNSIGFDMTRPNMISVDEVTARPKNVNKPMKTGRPMWPAT